MRLFKPGIRRGKRGVSLFLFLLFMVPAFIFGAAVGIDLSRVVTEFNYNKNTAQLAANAGATARDIQTGALRADAAAQRAQQVCIKMGSPCAVGVDAYRVDVAVPMEPFFLVSQWFGFPTGGVVPAPNFARLAATASANVCNSLENVGQGDLNCVRPE